MPLPCSPRRALRAALPFVLAFSGCQGCGAPPPCEGVGCPPALVGVTVRVTDERARACELVIATVVASAHYPDGVSGADVVRGDRSGLAFFRTSDAPFVDAAATLEVNAGASLALSEVTCFDTRGAAIPGAPLELTVDEEGAR